MEKNDNKFGLIFFKKTRNMGDDIQTYATYKLLPKVDYIIERESLNTFVSNNNEKVKTIISGWYLHNIYSFPPSPFIDPLIISTHFTNHLKNEIPEYMGEYLINYLKQHEPIGLRDNLIEDDLNKKNIKTYFSGCITLTLKPFKNIKKNKKICLVDLDDDIISAIKSTGEEVIIETHSLSESNEKLSFEDRMKNVEERLKLYQSCKCVISNRLHVVLPCLALGVSVKLIYDKNNIDIVNRLSNFLPYLNYESKEEFIKNINLKFKNKNDYLKLAKNIEDRVNKFLTQEPYINFEDGKLYNRYFIEQYNYLNTIKNSEIELLNKEIKEKDELIETLKHDLNKSEMIKDVLQLENEMLFAKGKECIPIINSKGYKILNKIRKVISIFKSIINRCINLLRRIKNKIFRRTK